MTWMFASSHGTSWPSRQMRLVRPEERFDMGLGWSGPRCAGGKLMRASPPRPERPGRGGDAVGHPVVGGEEAADADELPPGDGDEGGGAAGEGEDEGGGDVAGGDPARLVEGEGGEVGVLPHLQRPDAVIEPEGAGAAERRQLERHGGRKG